MGKRRDRKQQASNRRVKLDLSMDDFLLPSGTPGSLNDLDSTLGEDVKAGSKNQEIVNENPLLLLGQYSDDEADADDFGTGSLHDADSEAQRDSPKHEDEQALDQNPMLGDSGLEEKENQSTSAAGSNQQTSKEVLLCETGLQELTSKDEWQPVLDENSGEYYYWNVRNGETTWVNPIARPSANEPGSSSAQPLDMDPLLGTSAEQSPKVQMDTKDDHRESSEGERIFPAENCECQHPDKVISCVDSTETELTMSNAGLISGKKELPEAAPDTEERIDGGNPESTADSIDGPQDIEVLEKEGETKEEESVPYTMDDKIHADFENASNSQGMPGKNLQEVETSKSSSDLMEKTQPHEDVQDASVSTKTPPHVEVTRTIEEEMALIVEKIESLNHRLSTWSSHESSGSFTEISRHTLLVSQTEARLNDWKVFCALGFIPEACLSFMQKELMQLEQDVTAGEPKASEALRLTDPESEGHHGTSTELRESNRHLHWAYYQHANTEGVNLQGHGQPTDTTGKGDDVEEGEIQTSHEEMYPVYGCVSDGMTNGHAQHFSNGAGNEDADMDVDMEVDEDGEAEPAVPGSDVPVSDVPVVCYSYPYPHPGSIDISTLTHLDSGIGQPTSYFHTGISGYSWAPPLPPDDEWAPPPPGESEPAPPPPPDEPPPIPPQSPEVAEASIMPSALSESQMQYYLPEYSLDNNSVPLSVPGVAEYQSVVDPSVYGTYVEGIVYSNSAQSIEPNPYGDGVVYSNSAQPTEMLTEEQPYVLASGPILAFNGWTPPVLTSTSSSLGYNPISAEAPVMPASYASSAPTAISMAADSNVVSASLETKKPVKGKVKKRTHAVAAAPMLNKKVSSLVNKWKQAKEELHGGEDEDDDKELYDIELLEKKRQKEIEEWRRQQIASGEAWDNANFQPLGTSDWRERVKRARKLESKEGKEETTSSLASSTVENKDAEVMKSKKPDLSDLSKGLPAGWQAFWDETSGEVYYGNLTTQETSWDRPDTS